MQNVISFQQAHIKSEKKQADCLKKAFLLAQMHVYMNEAEKQRKSLYESYAKAFNESNTKEMQEIALQITEAGGKLSAFIKCINLIAINV